MICGIRARYMEIFIYKMFFWFVIVCYGGVIAFSTFPYLVFLVCDSLQIIIARIKWVRL